MLDIGEDTKWAGAPLQGITCWSPMAASPGILLSNGEIQTPLPISESPWQSKSHIPVQTCTPPGTLGPCQTKQ